MKVTELLGYIIAAALTVGAASLAVYITRLAFKF